jgi:hypothetical protein
MPPRKRRKARKRRAAPIGKCGTCEACRANLGYCPRSVRTRHHPEEEE